MPANTPLPYTRLRQCAGGFTAGKREQASPEEAALAPRTSAANNAKAITRLPPLFISQGGYVGPAANLSVDQLPVCGGAMNDGFEDENGPRVLTRSGSSPRRGSKVRTRAAESTRCGLKSTQVRGPIHEEEK